MGKKIIIGILVIALIAAIGVGVFFAVKEANKKKDEAKTEATPAATPTADVKKTTPTDEERVKGAVSGNYRMEYTDEIDTVEFQKVKIYTKDEIKNTEALKDYKLNDKDIVFEVDYSIKVTDKCKDLTKFTAGTGEIDGKVIKNKHNVGVLKYSELTDYELSNFGTGF